MNKLHVFALAALAFLVAPVASFAQFPAWTSVCSAGATIDETSAGIYAVGAPIGPLSSLGVAPAAPLPAVVTARYNVTNTSIPPLAMPPWDTFELGYTDTAASGLGNNVKATFYKVSKCFGKATTLCTITSTDSSVAVCHTCTFPPGTVIDFNINLYVVEVTVTRNVADGSISANTLRIYNTPP